jgi:hypothetical protein
MPDMIPYACPQPSCGLLAIPVRLVSANDDIPELLTLARTISRWKYELVCTVLTGVTNDLASHCTLW